MNHWTLIIGMMLVTFLPRYLPLLLAGKMVFPEWLERAFNYVPIAVLSAIIAQTTLIHDGAVQLDWQNAHLMAALAAFVVALKCNRQLVVISCGLLVFGLMRWGL